MEEQPTTPEGSSDITKTQSLSQKKRLHDNNDDNEYEDVTDDVSHRDKRHVSTSRPLKHVMVDGRMVCIDSTRTILSTLKQKELDEIQMPGNIDKTVTDWFMKRLILCKVNINAEKKRVDSKKNDVKVGGSTGLLTSKARMSLSMDEFTIDGTGGPIFSIWNKDVSATTPMKMRCDTTHDQIRYWIIRFAQEALMVYHQMDAFGVSKEMDENGVPMWFNMLKKKVAAEGGVTKYSYPFTQNWIDMLEAINSSNSRPATRAYENNFTKRISYDVNLTVYQFKEEEAIQVPVLLLLGDPSTIASDVGKSLNEIVGNPAYVANTDEGMFYSSNYLVAAETDDKKRYIGSVGVATEIKKCAKEVPKVYIATHDNKKAYIPFQILIQLTLAAKGRLTFRHSISSIDVSRNVKQTAITEFENETTGCTVTEKIDRLLTEIRTSIGKSACVCVQSSVILGVPIDKRNTEISDSMISGSSLE